MMSGRYRKDGIALPALTSVDHEGHPVTSVLTAGRATRTAADEHESRIMRMWAVNRGVWSLFWEQSRLSSLF